MVNIPNFLIRKIYRKGSLRETKDGIIFELKNILGPGMITGINFIKINDKIYHSKAIKLITSGMSILAEKIDTDNPILFRLNQEVTCLLEDAKGLQEGINNIIVELISSEAGHIQVNLSDTI